MSREPPVFPEAEPLHGDEDENPTLRRQGRLWQYYDWPALHGTRSARHVARVISSVTDSIFLPFILVAPSVGFTFWAGGRAGAAALAHLFKNRQRLLERIEREFGDARRVAIHEIPALADGTPVRVQGRIRVRRPLRCILASPGRAAYEWLMIREELLPERVFFVEHGNDFDLVGATGASVRVGVARARSVVEWRPDAHLVEPKIASALRDAVPRDVTGRRALALTSLAVSRLLLADGCDVDILGFVARVVDPDAPALPRDIPASSMLVGMEQTPLIMLTVPTES